MKPDMTLDDVREMMDDRYAKNIAYASDLPFDTLRGVEIRRTALELAGDNVAQMTLDIGSGEGGIASFWPHQNIVGVEISAVAVERARRAYPKVRYYNVPVERLETITEEPNQFECVVAQESIEHWVDVPAGLRAIRRKIAPTGAFVVTTPNRTSLHCLMSNKLGMAAPYCSVDHVHEFEFDELISTIESYGFKCVKSLGVHMAPYWSMEWALGTSARVLTDRDVEVNRWLNEIGRTCPRYAFIQCHRFEVVT